MNHTPGPWAKHTPSSPTQTAVIARELPDHQRTVVAVIPDHREFGVASVADFYEAEANARLIAAAPDLLFHLQRLVRAIDRAPANFADGLADEARAAIAKATV